ncbi:MAG: hypothetical protein AMDU3_IPLC00004G0190 [Thermoplasmatales archaeon I-plasma]|jgi:hypothetical protein|nr:MAG: hypothetical protein AMDU3_IPLC00004G0190 [Thermoplasmatales archaeon I-plasma]MDA8054122.1 HEPN domain-containing protein [Thermoplasmatales archaeon]
MPKSHFDLDKAIEQVRSKNSRFGIPLQTFIEESIRIDDVLSRSEKSFKEDGLRIWIRKAATIRMVTGFEVYFKDMLLDLVTRRRKLSNIVDQDDVISFKDLLDRRSKTFTIKQLMNYSILQKYNFLDLDDIEKAFSRALKISFFEVIKNNAVRISESGVVKVIPYAKRGTEDFYLPQDFYPKIKKIILQRHSYVHDINRKIRPSFKRISEENDEIFSFVFFIDLFINNSKFPLK